MPERLEYDIDHTCNALSYINTLTFTFYLYNCWKFTVVTLCAQLTHDLLAIAKFLVSCWHLYAQCEPVLTSTVDSCNAS